MLSKPQTRPPEAATASRVQRACNEGPMCAVVGSVRVYGAMKQRCKDEQATRMNPAHHQPSFLGERQIDLRQCNLTTKPLVYNLRLLSTCNGCRAPSSLCCITNVLYY